MKTHIPNRLKPLAFATVLAFAGSASAATFTVTNTANTGVGSLSDALTQASNCVGAPHTVNFAITTPPAPPFVITTGGTFNLGNCAGTLIDGYTQPGATPNTIPDASNGSDAVILIQIDGTSITGGAMFAGSGPNQTIRGLNMRNYNVPGSSAINLNNTTASIVGNFIGTDVSGNSCVGAGMTNGIQTPGGQIGSIAAADRNVIGCASGKGILAVGGGAAVIRGNLIGTGSGGAAINNGAEAIQFSCLSCFSNTVGGTLTGQGNVLSHSSVGVSVFTNANSTIVGNDIFGNTLLGIDIPGAPTSNASAVNPPSINAAGITYSAGSTTISGTFSSFSNQTGISVDFFQNLGGGLDQGEQYMGTAVGFSTNGSGAGTFSATVPAIVRNPTVTFTTSSATSKFSAPRPTPESVATPPTFPATTVGQASAVQPFTISNTSSVPLTVDFTNSNSAEFKDTTTPAANAYCGAGRDAVGGPLAAQATIPAFTPCTINMIFQPSAVGPRSANFQINSNAPQNPQGFILTGVGAAAPAPALSITPPPPVTFGTVTTNTTAGPQTLTLTNSGTAPLTFAGAFVVTGDYSQTTNCPVAPLTLASTVSCTVDVFFTPTVAGVRSGVLTINSDAPTSPDSVALTGTGSAAPVPVVSLAPTSLTFAAQSVGTTSAVQTATLTNTGTAALTISSIAGSGDFGFTTTCPASLAPTNSCPINVTFTPLVAGARAGSITIADNASGSPQVLSLNGTGSVAPVATITVTPPSVTFPPTQVGAVSAEQVVTIGNTGAGALTISSVQVVGGEFAVSFNGCTAALSTGGSCPVRVVFSPAAAGSRAATLRIISNAITSPTQITLAGTGTSAPTGTLAADPTAVSFLDQVVGTTSAAQPVAVSNTGVFPVTVSSVSVSGDFTQTNDCTVLAPGAGCTVTTVFGPTGLGTRNGALTIVSDASNPALSVSLLGNGVLTSFPVIQLSATSLSFGNRVMGVGSSAQAVTLKNAGGANLVINRIYTQGDFRQTSDCPASVVPGATCRIDTSFVASIPGTRGGKLLVDSNATTVPKTVDLAGTGCRFFTIPGSRIGSLVCF